MISGDLICIKSLLSTYHLQLFCKPGVFAGFSHHLEERVVGADLSRVLGKPLEISGG